MLVRRQFQIISLPQHNKVLENHNNCLHITGFTFRERERGKDIDPSARARKGETGEPLILGSCVQDWCNAHPNNSKFIIDVHIDKVVCLLFRNIQGFRIHLLSILVSKPFIISRKDEKKYILFFDREIIYLQCCSRQQYMCISIVCKLIVLETIDVVSVLMGWIHFPKFSVCLPYDGFIFLHTCTIIVNLIAVQEG